DEDIPLLDYAARWFEYYSRDISTSAASTDWQEGVEDLEDSYGGDEYQETHEARVKAEHIGGKAGCTSCSDGVSRTTRQYYYMHIWPNGVPESPTHQWWIWHYELSPPPNDVNETRMLVVEDTIAYDDEGEPYPLYRKIYALNDFS